MLFYTPCIRSVITYAVPVSLYALPKNPNAELEKIKKRALVIIGITMFWSKRTSPTITAYDKAISSILFDNINTKTNFFASWYLL